MTGRTSERAGSIDVRAEQELARCRGDSLDPPRQVGQSILRGLRCRCPACGVGPLFSRFLKLAPVCRHCGEELHHARPDDAPPYFVILFVGHLLVPLVLVLEEAFAPPLWTTTTVAAMGACLLATALLPPAKGAVVGIQWANRMHGFDPRERGEDRPFSVPRTAPRQPARPPLGAVR